MFQIKHRMGVYLFCAVSLLENGKEKGPKLTHDRHYIETCIKIQDLALSNSVSDSFKKFNKWNEKKADNF